MPLNDNRKFFMFVYDVVNKSSPDETVENDFLEQNIENLN